MFNLRFSIATLLFFTFVIAAIIAWWPVPDGQRSTDVAGFFGTDTQFVWCDDAQGTVELNSPEEPMVWQSSGIIEGSESVISLIWRGPGSFKQIQIQMPARVHRWERFSLRPLDRDRENSHSLSTEDRQRSKMREAEVAITFYSERQLPLPPEEVAKLSGSLSILGIDKATVTVSLTLENLAYYGFENETQVYSLDRQSFKIPSSQ